DAARDADERWVSSLIRQRCLAAARSGHYAAFKSDFAYLEKRWMQDGETWFRFLLALFDQLAFPSCQEGARCLQEVWERIHAFNDLHLEFDEQLLRLEQYADLALVCSQLDTSPNNLSTLAALTAIQVWRDGSEKLAYLLEPIA